MQRIKDHDPKWNMHIMSFFIKNHGICGRGHSAVLRAGVKDTFKKTGVFYTGQLYIKTYSNCDHM